MDFARAARVTGCAYDFTSDADHPEILMRAVRLLLLTERRRHDLGVSAILRPFERQLRQDRRGEKTKIFASLDCEDSWAEVWADLSRP
jgi:hypothetical protein